MSDARHGALILSLIFKGIPSEGEGSSFLRENFSNMLKGDGVGWVAWKRNQ